jgi:hypothetical protein
MVKLWAGMDCGGAFMGPFISLSTFLLFGSFGVAALVLLLLAWFGARLKVRVLQTQMSV